MNRPDLILDNKFWFDLAHHIVEKGSFEKFLSGNFFLASSNFSEMIFSCAFLDLPFVSGGHTTSTHEEKGVKMKFNSNAMLFKKEIKKAECNIGTQMHVIHHYFILGNEQDDKPIVNFLTHQVYGCEVIVTNVSSKKLTYQLLWQIPECSLPLQNTNYQKSISNSLEPYSTTTFTYYFYFPSEGEFIHFPSNLSINSKVVAVSNNIKFKVMSQADNTGSSSLLIADLEVLYEFLKTKNLFKPDQEFIQYWRLKDKTVYHEILQILRNRRIFLKEVWKFAFYHKDQTGIKEFISNSEELSNILGSNFESSLFENHHSRYKPRHLEYFPLVNSRAHLLGDANKTSIMNKELRKQYDEFLLKTVEKHKLESSDLLKYTYFLLLQDRIQEAITCFEQVDAGNLSEDGSLILQYDYMAAYLDFYTGHDEGFKVARQIIEKYKDYPVLHWRYLFDEV